MAIYRLGHDHIDALEETTFESAGIKERADLQRVLRSQVDVVAPGTMVVAEEFGEWTEGKRRIDLLALDQDANLVIVELKRTEDGGHMELQAIRYAAMVSTMTFEQVVEAHRRFRQNHALDGEARAAILDFLGWTDPDEELFGQDVRIVLASAEFSKELTTAVMWLNKRSLDIRCVRLKPYKSGLDVLLDVQQVIPLPEAAAYQVQVREKEQSVRVASARHASRMEFWAQLLAKAKLRTSLHGQISPSTETWISASAGRSGLGWNYAIRQRDAQVELYIDIGTQDENQKLLEFLQTDRQSIEASFGEELEWQPLPDKRACRVRFILLGGYRDPAETWPDLQDRMIDAMIRLEAALRPRLALAK